MINAHYIDQLLEKWLPPATTEPKRLHQAMRYVVLQGGKRIRPLLVFATGISLGASEQDMARAATAVEFIHAYSLAHDDLPAMDDDDLRRGQPTCHKAFDEATAILVGDALQCLAFELLTGPYETQLSSERRLNMAFTLARACSSLGMAGGQALDLAATGKAQSGASVKEIHQRKTAALIEASISLGAQCAPQLEPIHLKQLQHFGNTIGLAFQIHDDILDIEGQTETLGKQQGQDLHLNKATYPAAVGLEQAKVERDQLLDQALSTLETLPFDTSEISELTEFMVAREY